MEQVVSRYLKLLKIPVSSSHCERMLQSHAEYPSMLSITDTLERLGISYQAARLAREEIEEVAFPYLLHPDREKRNGSWVLITSESDYTEFFDSTEQESDAYILQAEPVEAIQDEEVQKQYQNETYRRIVVAISLISITGLFLLPLAQVVDWMFVPLMLLSLCGVTTGYFLFARELGVKYPAVEALCSKDGSSGCGRLLQSEDAQIFGRWTFSDAAFSYFLFQLIVLGLLLPITDLVSPFLTVLFLMSMLALPVVGYSLYLQAVRMQWCRLCLIVDGILLTQAALFAQFVSTGTVLLDGMDSWIVPASSLILFGLIVSLVILVKLYVEGANRSSQRETNALRVKNSPFVFVHLLKQQRSVDTTPFEKELLIGNREAPIKILMAASLGCGPCKSGFEKVMNIFHLYPEKVHVSIRFSIKRVEYDNSATSPGAYILGYWLKNIHGNDNESEETEQLIRDWYSLMNLDEFKKRYPKQENLEDDEVKDLCNKHRDWIEEAEIAGTPTFFVDGYSLPNQFRINDLLTLIPGLSFENHRQMNVQNNDIPVSEKEIV
ncbi:MAG: thioredoxin domain-containing protein [Balneolaceae bacterium]